MASSHHTDFPRPFIPGWQVFQSARVALGLEYLPIPNAETAPKDIVVTYRLRDSTSQKVLRR